MRIGLYPGTFDPVTNGHTDIIKRALSAPIKQIAANGGMDGSIVAQKVEEAGDTNFGFNALNGEYEDLVKAGVIDPTKVARTALQNAASVASLLLATDCIVTANVGTPLPLAAVLLIASRTDSPSTIKPKIE